MDNNDTLQLQEFWPHKWAIIRNILLRLGGALGLLAIGLSMKSALPPVASGVIRGGSIGIFIVLIFEILMYLVRLPKVLSLKVASLSLSPDSLTFFLPNAKLSATVNTIPYTVKWENVKELTIYRSGFVVLMGLDVKNIAEILPPINDDDQNQLKKYKRLSGKDLVFSIGDFKLKPEELMKQLSAYQSLDNAEISE